MLIGGQGAVQVQLDLPGGQVRRCETLLTQLWTQQLLGPGPGVDTVDRCGHCGQVSVDLYLLVVLRMSVSDGPGPGSDHPAPHSLPVLLRDTTAQKTFDLGGRTQVIVRPAGQVLGPATQQGMLRPFLQGHQR